MNLRLMKTVLVGTVAAWGVLDGIGNLIVYDTWLEIVSYVLALENTQIDGHAHPRAIFNPLLPHIGYAFIYTSKFFAGILCAISARRLWLNRHQSVVAFEEAKSMFYLGAGVLLFMLTFGFIILKGTVFNTGQLPSDFTIQVNDFVVLYLVMLGFITVYVSLPERELTDPVTA